MRGDLDPVSPTRKTTPGSRLLDLELSSRRPKSAAESWLGSPEGVSTVSLRVQAGGRGRQERETNQEEDAASESKNSQQKDKDAVSE